jgi:hypothetical protein
MSQYLLLCFLGTQQRSDQVPTLKCQIVLRES